MYKQEYYQTLVNYDPLDLLLISFCMIDKEFHFLENNYLLNEGIKPDTIESLKKFMTQETQTPESVFLFALETISEDLFEIAAVALVDIAWADGKIANEERNYIKKAEKAWNIEINLSDKSSWQPTEEQSEIISSNASRRLIVEAKPGCGKTTTAWRRINHLLEDCDVESSEIFFFAFTNQAIKELEERIKDSSTKIEAEISHNYLQTWSWT